MIRSCDHAISEAAAAKAAGADIVEFRVDEFFDPSVVEADPERRERDMLRMVRESPLPCIVTCRSSREGGGYAGTETERLDLYERLARMEGHPPRYLDFEHSMLVGEAGQRLSKMAGPAGSDRSPGLILSTHDFHGRPADLSRRVLAMRGEALASVVKIAYRARSLRDNLELFELLREATEPTIALGMGEFGLMSRVLAPKFGGFLTFASLRPEAVTAPGQPTVGDLLEMFRFRAIRRTTKVFGVIGWPVGHSMSPLVHNAVFGEVGFDGVYLPLPIPGGEQPGSDGEEASYASFKATVGALIDDPALDFGGASVTLPHKENLVRFARERFKSEPGVWSLDAVSLATGAGNSLLIERSQAGRIERARVFNTDVPAAVEPLRAALGSLAGRAIAVLGAGGVARGIAFGLASAGARVTIFNRSTEKAQRLAEALSAHLKGGGAISVGALETLENAGEFAGFVQCTPVGMAGGPGPEGCPLPVVAIERSRSNSGNNPEKPVVLDTVYNPVRTPLVRAALEQGWRVIDGVVMFVEQAARQSEAWTGTTAPREMMERLVRARLGPPKNEA